MEDTLELETIATGSQEKIVEIGKGRMNNNNNNNKKENKSYLLKSTITRSSS